MGKIDPIEEKEDFTQLAQLESQKKTRRKSKNFENRT